MLVRALTLAVLLLLLAAPTQAAITHVQTRSGGVNPDVSLSVTLTLTAGNAVIAHLLLYDQASGTQTAGDTLTARVSTTHAGGAFVQYDNLSVAGGSTTFTFTFTSTAAELFVSEFSGLATSAAFDQSSIGTAATATSWSTGTTGATAQASELLIAALHMDGAGSTSGLAMTNSFTVPTSGGDQGDRTGAITGIRSAVGYRIVNGQSTYETTFSVADSASAKALLGTYKDATITVAPSSSKRSRTR